MYTYEDLVGPFSLWEAEVARQERDSRGRFLILSSVGSPFTGVFLW